MAVHVERGSEQTALVRFSLPESEDPSAVSLVGSFNQWTPGAHPLHEDLEGAWSVTIEVPYGEEIHFRYLGESGRWFDDPDAEVSGDDGGRIMAVAIEETTDATADATTDEMTDETTDPTAPAPTADIDLTTTDAARADPAQSSVHSTASPTAGS